MTPMGGSEILYHNFIKYVGTAWQDKVNLIMSSCNYSLIDPNKINVVWQHLNSNEENVALMADPAFIDKVDYFVFVSHWQYNRFKHVFQVPAYKCIVIKNAIEPIHYLTKPNTPRLKLIYTSTPWRGLDILLDAFDLMKRDDIELDIYSSAKIYGDNFVRQTAGQFDALFDRARYTPNVNFFEYAPNTVVRKAVQEAHIFAYPNVFEETSCLSAIEAAAGGCAIITTSHGALPETCSDWAKLIPLGPNRDVLVTRFATELDTAIDKFWDIDKQTHLIRQSDHYNHYWSWDYRKKEWQDFLKNIKAYV